MESSTTGILVVGGESGLPTTAVRTALEKAVIQATIYISKAEPRGLLGKTGAQPKNKPWYPNILAISKNMVHSGKGEETLFLRTLSAPVGFSVT